MSEPILAHHAHVFPAAVNPAGTIDALLAHLDACGIAEAVCFAPFADQVRDHVDNHNTWLAGQIAQQPRLHGFGTIDMHRQELADQVRHVADLGFKGIKVHPNHQRVGILSDRALAVYEAAEQAGLYLSFHTGVHHSRLATTRVVDFDEIAFRFPGLRFSLEHVGGYHFFHEALAVIFNNIPFPPDPGRKAKVFGGLTSVFSPEHLRFWYLSPDRLRELIAQVGARQLHFGLDFPYNAVEHTRLAIATIRGLNLPADDERRILGGTLREELGLRKPAK